MSVWLEEGIAELATLLREEAKLVSRAVRGAAAAFSERDPAAADAVIASDDGIDDCYLRVEQGIQILLARQTPVAVDLRRVLAMLHVNLHLERIGDYCVTIAKLARLTVGLPVDQPLELTLERMAERAGEIVDAAVESFSRCLERIGDHAVDIGEQTAYMVTGTFHEFTDASHPLGSEPPPRS
jgi:phosphate transport system protein